MPLVDSWGYEPYVETKYFNGDKPFGELKKGDVVYLLDKGNELQELEVTKGWHKADGHFYLTCNRRKIDFGSANIANVSVEAPRNSIAYHTMGILGTNKKSVIEMGKEDVERLIEYYNNQKEAIQKKIDELVVSSIKIDNLNMDW